MYTCKNCGNKVPEGNKFCGVCGTPVQNNGTSLKSERKIIEDYAELKNSSKTFKRKRKKPIIVWIILGIIIAFALIFSILKFKNSSLNPFIKTLSIADFIEDPIFEGINEEGTLDKDSLKLNRDMLEEKLREKLGEDASFSVSDILDNITFIVNPNSKLKNGDKITVIAQIRNKENLQDSLGIRFTNTSKEFTIKDLKELLTVDPFDGFKPKFKGISPKLKIKITSKKLQGDNPLERALGSASEYYDIYRDGKKLDDDQYVKIGDEIKFVFNQDGIDRLHEYAYKPSNLEKEYKITNKDARSYILTKEELDPAFFEKIKDQAYSIVKSDLASRNNADTPVYSGLYFLTPKETGLNSGGIFSDYNVPVMYLVYSYNVESYDEVKKEYTAVEVSNFLVDKIDTPETTDEEEEEETEDEGEKIKSEVSTDNSKPEQIIDYKNINKVYGRYETMDELKLDQVESKLKDYNYEVYDGATK